MTTMSSAKHQEAPLSFDAEAEERAIAAAQGLKTMLRERTQRHHELGELTPEVVDKIVEYDLHNLAVPKRWHGNSLSSVGLARVSAEIAKGCPSTAWCVSITNSVAWLASQVKDSMQKAVFENGTPLLTSPQNGMGSVKEVEGGYLLTGRWSYGSNCHHASYALLQGILNEEIPVMCLVGVDSVTRVNTWDVVGMRGSGSDTLVAESVFVPVEHACKMAGVTSMEQFSYEREATDYWVTFPLLRAKALGILVGAAEALLEVVAAAGNKPLLYSIYDQKQLSASYRAYLGEVAAKIRSARIIMDSSNALNDAAALAGRAMDNDERHHVRAEVALAIKLLGEACHTLMDLAGSSGFSESNLAQRYWLDFNVGCRHVIFNSYVSFEAYGDFELGRDLTVMDSLFV